MTFSRTKKKMLSRLRLTVGNNLIKKGADATIRNVGRLGKDGMKETNDEIISIMVSSC